MIGPPKPPAFNDNDVEHRRQIADFVNLSDSFVLDHLEHSMTGNEDDVPLYGYTIVRIDSDGAYDLTGIVAEPGRRLLLINVSAFTITLKDELTSVAENQFKLGSDFALLAEGTVELWYDRVTTRWRRIAG